jgi:alpha-galactosidase
MPKIAFMGAGSTVFAKSILGDSLCAPALQESELALYDIDPARLQESKQMLEVLNANLNQNRARIAAHLGVDQRREALRGADYVVNAIQVGGYEPSTVIDFEIPKKYGLRQTIADTLGIGGIFRSLRTIPVVLDFCRDMEAVCPDALFINYVNPMAMITGAILEGSAIRAVGLCHSVQGCANGLLWRLGLNEDVRKLRWKIAGINHQAWLLEITDGGRDLYPAIRRRAAELVAQARQRGRKWLEEEKRKHEAAEDKDWWRKRPDLHVFGDLVRLTILLHFGYYVTESSEHTAEYTPWFIKRTHPELIDEFNIPLDEYPRRCIHQIEHWKKRSAELVNNPKLDHKRGGEFGSYIMEAMETGTPIRVHGNVLNTGLITNLPRRTCVEVPCLVDRNGIQGCHVGDLPEQCAGLNRTNVNVQLLTVEAALKRRKDLVYQAAALDPHTGAELTLDEIRRLCDDLFEAHREFLPAYT